MKFRTLLVIFILKLHTQLFYCEGSDGLVDQNDTPFPRVIDLGGGKFDFGGVLIDQKLKRLSFDAVCNQTSGLVEYALVHQSGKLHESLFSTKIPPRWIHACLLLLKAKPLGGNFLSQEFKSQLAEDMIPEYQVNAQVSWEGNESIITGKFLSWFLTNCLSAHWKLVLFYLPVQGQSRGIIWQEWKVRFLQFIMIEMQL